MLLRNFRLSFSLCRALGQWVSSAEVNATRAMHETVVERRARLLYQSRKRGILENDLILGAFFDKFGSKLTEEELNSYDKLINNGRSEWDLYYWITGARQAPDEFKSGVMEKLNEFVRTESCGEWDQPKPSG